MAARIIALDRPLDLGRTLGPLRHGPADPTISIAPQRVARTTRTADGPATVLLRVRGSNLEAEAWGAGAQLALDAVPALVGLDDDPEAFRPHHSIVAELHRRLPGLRIGRTGAVVESLVPAILEQKVTGQEAFAAWSGIVRRYGEPAPGPIGLLLAPAASTLAALPYHAFHRFSVERRRADTIRWAAARARRIEEIVGMPLAAGYARLQALPGVGPWTAAEVGMRALGDADAVSVGDFHLPHLVSWLLAGERRADDARMLELLEPYRGQRGRVIRLFEASGMRPARRAPRLAPRSIARI
jgi:3-methyladenine DNA glycosylase/8-oxoguanine DNA glycosylase